MHTKLRNTVGSMRSCAKNEKKERLNMRDNVVVLKLRLHMRRLREKSSHLQVVEQEACLEDFLEVSLVACQQEWEECLEVSLAACQQEWEECLEVSLAACQQEWEECREEWEECREEWEECQEDPELMAAFKDPEVMTALQDVMKNPANLAKHQANPKVAPIIAKMMGKFAGSK
ncbi:hypothetical protein CsSME_00050237 [Camellia sinensis var. sinensis]